MTVTERENTTSNNRLAMQCRARHVASAKLCLIRTSSTEKERLSYAQWSIYSQRGQCNPVRGFSGIRYGSSTYYVYVHYAYICGKHVYTCTIPHPAPYVASRQREVPPSRRRTSTYVRRLPQEEAASRRRRAHDGPFCQIYLTGTRMPSFFTHGKPRP